MARHYHVLCGLRGGFMPDSNDIADTLPEAREQAATEAEAWGEVHGKRVHKLSEDYYVIGQFCVEVWPCDATDCEGDHA